MKLLSRPKSIYFLIFSIILSSSFPINASSYCKTDTDCERLYLCQPITQSCVHKSLFPMEYYEILGIFVIIFFTIISSIAGGAVFQVTLTLIIFNFSPQDASAISSISLVVVNMVRYLITFRERLPQGRPVVNYELLALMTPNLIIGSAIGVLINFVFRDWIYMILLTTIFIYLSYKSYFKGVELYRKEKLDRKNLETLLNGEVERANYSVSEKMVSHKLLEQDTQEISKLDFYCEKINPNKSTMPPLPENILNLEYKQVKTEEELIKGNLERRSKRLINSEAIFVFLFSTLLISVISVLRGPKEGNSVVGVKICSASWWVLSFAFIPIGLVMNYILVKHYSKEYLLKKKYGLRHLDTFELKKSNIIKILLIGTLAGFVVALLGISGGIIVGPILIQLNLNPREATYTGSLVGIITALNSAIQILVLKPVFWDYALMVAISGSVGCLLAMLWIMDWIKRKKADSYVVFSIFISLLISLIFTNLVLGLRINKEYNDGKDVFSLNGICY